MTGVIGEVSMVAAGASMVEAGKEAVPSLRVLYCPDLSSMRKCWLRENVRDEIIREWFQWAECRVDRT